MCATAAAAAPEAALYRLTVSGTARATWDHTGPPAATPDCTSSQSAHGVRVVRFRSTRPRLVRLADGRVTPMAVRHLGGRVTASGQNTANETCAGVENHSPKPCADAAYTFRDAHAVVFSPGRRALSFRGIGMVVRHSGCPREPAGVLPLGPPPTFRLSEDALEPRIVRITATASAARRMTYGTPEDGKLVQRSSWKVTLTRVRP